MSDYNNGGSQSENVAYREIVSKQIIKLRLQIFFQGNNGLVQPFYIRFF